MSMRTLEAAILLEARKVTGRKKLRKKDILEWTTGTVKSREGESIFYLPDMGVEIAVQNTAIKK